MLIKMLIKMLINITINPSKKRSYKKRVSTTQQRQQQPITIINQIPYTQQQEQQNIPKPMDFKKTAFNYNMPRHKPLDISKEEPRPPLSKAPLKLTVPKDNVKIPSKPIKNDNPMLKKKSSPLNPVEELNESREKSTVKTTKEGVDPTFESQVPLSEGFNEDESEYLNLTTLKPTNRINMNNDFTPFYGYFDTSFQSQIPTTYGEDEEDNDDVPDAEIIFDSQVPTTMEEIAKSKQWNNARANYIKNIVRANTNRINSGLDTEDIANEQIARTSFQKLKKNRKDNINERNNIRREQIEMASEDKNMAILKPPEQETFVSQVPSAQGFSTPERRRDTIIPTYQPPSAQTVLSTPDIMGRILNRTRRKKQEMDEARAMGEEDKYIMGKVPASSKSKNAEDRQKALKKRGDKLIQSLQQTRDLAYNINI